MVDKIKNKKIFLFSRDPGGANTIIPLVGALIKKGYTVELYGKDVALKRYKIFNLISINLTTVIDNISIENLIFFFKNNKPDFIITGTSADDMTEKYIWKAAEDLAIPCFAILDNWMNYGVRFSEYGVSELESYSKNKKHDYLPTKILTMDKISQQEIVNEGISKSKILVTGHPYFEFLTEIKNNHTKYLNKVKKNFVITYVSEPICKTYKENKFSNHYWGYTERTIFNFLLDSLKHIASNLEQKIKIIIKLHPKENQDNYDDFINDFKHEKISLILDKISNSWDLIFQSDLICGMSSMMLLESVILGKPILSIQIGLTRDNPFVLSRLGIVKSVTSKSKLQGKLKEILIDKRMEKVRLNFVMNPIEKVIEKMEELF